MYIVIINTFSWLISNAHRPILAQSLEEGNNVIAALSRSRQKAQAKEAQYRDRMKQAVVESVMHNINETKSEIAQREIYHSKWHW